MSMLLQIDAFHHVRACHVKCVTRVGSRNVGDVAQPDIRALSCSEKASRDSSKAGIWLCVKFWYEN